MPRAVSEKLIRTTPGTWPGSAFGRPPYDVARWAERRGRGQRAEAGELEAEIMDRLWRWRTPSTVRRIVDDLNRTRPVAYTTVITVADILHTKGWVKREKIGRAWIYEARQSREQYTAGLMRAALGDAADRHGTLLHFVERMSQEEVQALDAALRQVRRPDSAGA